MRMVARRFFALALVLSSLAACGVLIGVEPLDVDPADASPEATVVDVVQAPDVSMPKPPVDAGPADAPIDVASAKRVFLTSKPLSTKGMFGGASAADTLCNTTAKNAGLGSDGGWVAWLSGSGRNAIQQLTSDLPYRLLDNTPVVKDRTELVTTGPRHPINVTEDGKVATDSEPWVWTGTTKNGLASSFRCSDWSTTNPVVYGIVGSFDQASKWDDNGGPGAGFPGFGCQTLGRFYCFEK